MVDVGRDASQTRLDLNHLNLACCNWLHYLSHPFSFNSNYQVPHKVMYLSLGYLFRKHTHELCVGLITLLPITFCIRICLIL